MARGIRLFKILGIQISIDYTWFIVFVLVAWSLAYGYFPFHYPGFDRLTYLSMGVVSALLLFACVLIHEISHSYTANRLGLDIHGITLFIFGGVAELTREPEDASVELKIAIAGPAASAALAVIFWLLSRTGWAQGYPVAAAVFSYLSVLNAILLVFNMIPGFPLDGGRVLRALWWLKTGDLTGATRVASRIGKGFAIFLILSGFLQIAVGNFVGGLWSVFIGVFLQQAAESGYQQLLMKQALNGVKVKDVMSKGVISVPGDAAISDVIEGYFLRYHYASFPVISNGKVAGMLAIRNVREIERESWPSRRAMEIMMELGPQDVLDPDESALTALQKLSASHIGRCLVIRGNEMLGILSRSDIVRMMEFRSAIRH